MFYSAHYRKRTQLIQSHKSAVPPSTRLHLPPLRFAARVKRRPLVRREDENR